MIPLSHVQKVAISSSILTHNLVNVSKLDFFLYEDSA